MKLRLLDDTIRMRLSRGEVVAADEQGVVEGRTRFPGGAVFTFALETFEAGPEARASFANDRMVVQLPASGVSAWANDDAAVSLRAELELPGGERLKLLVEKDFECVTPREGEDQSDLFPNPEKTC